MKKFSLFLLCIFIATIYTSATAQNYQYPIPSHPGASPIISSSPKPQKQDKNEDHSPKNINTETKKQKNTFPPLAHQNCVPNPKIHTFMYHYIRNHNTTDSAGLRALSVPPETFEEQMRTVSILHKHNKIALMTGEEFTNALKTRCFPHENIWIFTSDDGWDDNFYFLAPIAEKYKIPFIFGIVSGTTKTQGFMTEEEIKELSDNPLFTIASHSITHAALNYGSLAKAKSEICDSKAQLEKITGKNVDIFIYPYGKIGRNSIRFIKGCGYSAAWSTDFGEFLNWKHPNFFNMNRIHVGPNRGGDFFENLAK